MRKAIGTVSIIGLLFVTSGTGELAAKQVEFNYQGRVKVHGQPFNGLGKFKFAIVDSPATVSYWSNDGTSTAASEPSAAVDITVSDGVFNVIIGDDSLPNMTKLPPTIFNIKNKKLHLRSWFSDGTHGFEQLHPDKQITNAMLFGIVSPEGLDIYVDPATGDDDYPGTNPDHPKRTIQSAWDSLPALLEESATIHLADGIYRDQAVLTGKTVIADATITILGNVTTPGAVRITGADSGNETLPVRDYGIRIDDQRDLVITGVLMDYFGLKALSARQSTFTMTDCEFAHNGSGEGSAIFTQTCVVHLYRVNSTEDNVGVYMERHGMLYAKDCELHDNPHRGFGLWGNSHGILHGCLVDGCDNTGVLVSDGTSLNFSWRDPCQVSNCEYGLFAQMNASISKSASGVLLTGNTTDEHTETGGQIW